MRTYKTSIGRWRSLFHGNPIWRVSWENWVQSRSSNRAKSVYACSDFLHGVRKHRKMRAISRWLSRMVSETKAWKNMEQLQGSLCSSLQGDPKIIKDLKDWRMCRKRACRTSQCGTFHQYAAGPNPGAGESRNVDTSRQNLGCSTHEYDLGAINPSRYPNRKTRDSAIQECPSEKIGTSLGPGRARPSGGQQSNPIR